MSDIVAEGDSLNEVKVEIKHRADGTGNTGDLNGVGHAGTVVVAFRLQEHLGFVHQAAECLTVDDAVDIPLIAGTHILFPVFLRIGSALALISKR